MSTILKALRRLEEEKASGTSRPLREEVATPPFDTGPPRRRGIPVVGLSIVFAVLLAFGAWWLLPRPGADDSPVAAGAAEPEQIARVESEPAPSPLRPTAVASSPAGDAADSKPLAASGPPEQAFSSPVEVVPRPPVTPRVPIEMSLREEVAAARPAASEPVAESAKSPPAPAVVAGAPFPKARSVVQKSAESKPSPRRSTAPVAAPPAPAKPTAAEPLRPAAVAVAPKPDPQPAPEVVKSAVAESAPPAAAAPRIRVDKTLWHPRRERREADVGVDGAATRRVHEGDVVGHFVVSEIQPSGVVFEGDGTTLRRGIGAE